MLLLLPLFIATAAAADIDIAAATTAASRASDPDNIIADWLQMTDLAATSINQQKLKFTLNQNYTQ